MAARVKATQKRQMAGFWFVLPAFLMYCLFFAYPFFRTVYLSFTTWGGLGQPEFVGLANYGRLFADPLMWSSLWNNVIWVFWGTIIPISIGLVLSVILWTGVKGSLFFRTVYFLPMVLSPVVVGVIWGWIYNPLFGILNKGLQAVGLGSWARGWLGEPSTALYAVMLTAIWTYIGFCVVVLFSGLQKVPNWSTPPVLMAPTPASAFSMSSSRRSAVCSPWCWSTQLSADSMCSTWSGS
jgi:raffinose/stachyose/melibiose transport system permease protein